MKISNYAPARWSRRAWIAAFMIPGTLALTLTACAQAPEPTLEDAGMACIEYVRYEKDVTTKKADRVCEIMYDDLGHDAFIKLWSDQ